MACDTIKLHFNPEFQGTLTSPSGSIALGDQPNGLQPYHLLFGALGSCFYATFLSIAVKKKLTFKDADITIDGTKRTTTPPTLETVTIKLVITDPSDEAGLRRSAELGTQYCSINETVSKVAIMHLDIVFQYGDNRHL